MYCMKVAIIGTGNIANMHAKAIRSLGHELVLAVNPNGAPNFAAQWDLPAICSTVNEALQYKFDVAHVCSPPALHYKQIKALLLAKKHVVCEKPFCLEDAQAQELLKLSKQMQCICAVCFNNRYYPAVQSVKEALQDAKIFSMQSTYLQKFHIMPCLYSWRYQEHLAGKMRAVTEIASHAIDLLCFVGNTKVKSVSALFQKCSEQRILKDRQLLTANEEGQSVHICSEDAATIQLRMQNNSIVSLFVSEVSFGKDNELKFHIDSNTCSVAWNSENPYELYFADAQGAHSKRFAFSHGFAETFSLLIEDVYNTIQNKASNSIFAGFTEAKHNVNVCNAIYQSATQNGKVIELCIE